MCSFIVEESYILLKIIDPYHLHLKIALHISLINYAYNSVEDVFIILGEKTYYQRKSVSIERANFSYAMIY